jgi:hypothetical protein
VSKLRLTASIVWHYPQTQLRALSRCLYLVTLAVERRDMADGWLLKGLEDLVSKVRLLERENREAVARIQTLERENCEMAALIALASAKVDEVLKEGTTVDIS